MENYPGPRRYDTCEIFILTLGKSRKGGETEREKNEKERSTNEERRG